MKKCKVIKDLVHDYIEIDDFFEGIINTYNFQRLKDIKQLTCQYVYPSATHTRFEHSLGVYFLVQRSFKALKYQLINEHNVSNENYNSLYFHLSIAAILHDIGHAPLSHLGEKYFRKNEIRKKLSIICEDENINIDQEIFKVGSGHELMSCYVLLKKYKVIILERYSEINFEFICRCIVGAQYEIGDKWIDNIVIELLNSTTIDMDKLDYIMRDSYMTGISVPKIDITRLFCGMTINNITKKLAFEKQAITVVQNIIDARDALYLLVYNHHIAVYTDFAYEFCIKHLIKNFENRKQKGESYQYEDELDPYNFFSCEAISEKLISDSELNAKLKGYINYNGKISLYTKNILPQIFERNFLKPLWKNLYDYKFFLERKIDDSVLIKDLQEKMCSDNYIYRRYIAGIMIEKLNVRMGQVFIVPRSNKFYSLNVNSQFNIMINNKSREIKELLPQRDFGDLYNNISFYIFCPEGLLTKAEEIFIEIVSKGLPPEDKLGEETTKLEWLEKDFN